MKDPNWKILIVFAVFFHCFVSAFPLAALEKSDDLVFSIHLADLSTSIPGQLNYQGFLAGTADSSAVTATLEMTFRLFDSQTKGAELWSETHPAVQVRGGLFQVLLGSVTSFPEGLFDGSPLWLQTEVGTEILTPRKPLVSVAYSQTAADADHAAAADHATTADQAASSAEAEHAARADTADWADDAEHAVHADTAAYSPSATAWTVSGDDVYRETGKVGIGMVSPQTELDVAGTVQATGFRMPTGASDSYVLTSDSSGSATWQAVSGGAGGDITAVTAGTGLAGGGTTGDVELQVEVPLSLSGSVSGSGSVIEGANTGSGNGLSGTSTSNYGVYGISTDGIGVLGECPDGAGVAGYSTNGYAGYFDGKGYFSGNVGIGTQTPERNLHIRGANPRILIEANSSNPEVNFKNDGDASTDIWALYKDWTTDDLRFFQKGGDRVTIQGSTGNVGIGKTNPSVRLDVSGEINADSLYRIAGNTVLSISGSSCLFAGTNAGTYNTGVNATFVGDSTGYNNQGHYNTFLGSQAGRSNTSGYGGTFIGSEAGRSNTSGDYNVFVGHKTGESNQTGRYNTEIGSYAGHSNTTGQRNTFVGHETGNFNTTGSSNTFLGSAAGNRNAEGDSNVFIGSEAGYWETGSNKLYISNSSSAYPLVYGEFDNKTLNINGDVGIGAWYPPDMKLKIQGDWSDFALIGINQRGPNNYAGLRLDRDENEKWFVGMSNINDNLTFRRTASSNDMVIDTTGKVGIGMQTPSYKLDVAGDINTTGEIRRNGSAYNHPDYVFGPDYELMSLEDLREYVSENQCLPGMPSAQQVREEGVKLFEQNRLQVEKLEEAYLYILSLQENILVLKENILVLEERITELEGSQE